MYGLVSFAARLHPDPLRSLSASQSSYPWPGEDVEIKEEGNGGGRKARKRRERKLRTHEVFYEHVARSLIQPPMNCCACNGR